jgi:hypothetical protein
MITHIVFFKLKDRSPDSVKEAAQVISNMRGKIPVLKELEVGIDVVHSERSYDIALIAKFDSLEDLKVYDGHPEHLVLKEYMLNAREGASLAVDFES